MSVEVTEADGGDRWRGYVERSPHGGLFHQPTALSVVADHAGADRHLLAGYAGEEPVGAFPVFEFRRGPVPLAFSPPPDLRVPYLGPALLGLDGPKRPTVERRHREFVEGCLEWVAEEVGPWYGHVRTSPAYSDPRPFVWSGADAAPNYTYLVDLTVGEDDLLASFSRDARSNVTGEYGTEYAVEVGGRAAVRDILAQVGARYEAQGERFGVPTEFVLDLHERLPDGQVRPYVLSVGGEFVGGILALRYGDTIARWLGGVRTDGDVDLPVNDLLDWAVMRDGLSEGLSWYDLVGADTPRVNRYKAKFNPELAAFYRIDLGSRPLVALAHAYQRFK